MEGYINQLKEEFKNFIIVESVNEFTWKGILYKVFNYKLYDGEIRRHTFEFKEKISIEQLAQYYIDSYMKEGVLFG